MAKEGLRGETKSPSACPFSETEVELVGTSYSTLALRHIAGTERFSRDSNSHWPDFSLGEKKEQYFGFDTVLNLLLSLVLC